MAGVMSMGIVEQELDPNVATVEGHIVQLIRDV